MELPSPAARTWPPAAAGAVVRGRRAVPGPDGVPGLVMIATGAVTVGGDEGPRPGTVPAGSQNYLLPPNGSSTLAIDSPYLLADATLYPTGNYVKQLNDSRQFETDLVYDPASGGIWVGIAKMSWSLSGNATFNGVNSNPPVSYTDPSKWTYTASPSKPDTINGAPGTFLPFDWSNYASNVKFS